MPICFALFAAFFPDRFNYFWSLLAAIVLYLAAVRAGKGILQQKANEGFYFPFGLGILLLISYICCSITTHFYLVVGLWCILAVLAFFELPLLKKKISASLLIALPFLFLGFWSSLTPPTFFDALVYHLGLPYQYLHLGRMQVIPYHLYSSFPPFDQVLNLLFTGINAEPAMKLFAIILLFGMLHCAKHTIDGADVRLEWMVIPFLCVPAVWILVHLVTADLLTAFFFSSGIFLWISGSERRLDEPDNPDERDPPDKKSTRLVVSAALIAFSCWTKWNVLMFLPFAIVLSIRKWKRFILLTALVVLFTLPVFVRNWMTVGDPLYPMLSLRLHNPRWSMDQQLALQKDSFPARTRSVTGVLTAPVRLISNPDDFGSASEIGFAPIVGLLLYSLARKQRSRLLLYIAICFFVWVYIFPNFRQFAPIFVLLIPIVGAGWSMLREKSRFIAYSAIAICFASSIYTLLPVYQQLFPLISTNQDRDRYLESNITYYPITRSLESGRAILVGETRSAYFRVPLIVSSSYDKSPFLDLLHRSADADSLYRALVQEKITAIVYNRAQFQQRAKGYGIWKVSPDEEKLLEEFVQKYTKPVLRVNGIYLLQIATGP